MTVIDTLTSKIKQRSFELSLQLYKQLGGQRLPKNTKQSLRTSTSFLITPRPLNLNFRLFHSTKLCTMPRNVEIKASVENLEELKKKAREISGDEGVLIHQEDTFFKVPNGRLKLRQLKGKTSVLIQYVREDKEGPKLSDYKLVEIDDDEGLKEALSNSVGILGVVKKERLLVMCGQTRIHLDQVAGLGQFMELEVVLRDDQTLEEGQEIAEGIMKDLNISQSSLIHCAYMDLILKDKS